MALVADELRLRLISLVAIRAVHVTEVAVMRIRIKIFRHLGELRVVTVAGLALLLHDVPIHALRPGRTVNFSKGLISSAGRHGKAEAESNGSQDS